MIDPAIRARDAQTTENTVHSAAGRLAAADRRELLREYDALAAAARKVTQHHFDTCDEAKHTGPCSCGVDDLRKILEGTT